MQQENALISGSILIAFRGLPAFSTRRWMDCSRWCKYISSLADEIRISDCSPIACNLSQLDPFNKYQLPFYGVLIDPTIIIVNYMTSLGFASRNIIERFREKVVAARISRKITIPTGFLLALVTSCPWFVYWKLGRSLGSIFSSVHQLPSLLLN